ncbi:Deoxyribodipyrimidine photolyase [Candidatus Nitrosarchaeum limnium SFB1]|jgi:deoxyribodipyrimidine photo-lyase|uniref:Deoxyribodipyrimidine photolyase n=1 Tax=Candidatus Nitrosarchaeum limnium SFB1 TaxID=886738 RepID=F3KHW4_9ARCH|nr:Deoxyribodipyrimidine photolyase [Candidatus Nitrosarchaeum limnium SFB1]
MSKYKKTLFIFRRDLRLEDNTGLIYALKTSNEVIPCFILDTDILDNLKKSRLRIKFLNESLKDLNEQLIKRKTNLRIFRGRSEEIIEKIILENKIDGVFLNGDYTKFAQLKENKIKKICNQKNIGFNKFADYLLHVPDEIHTKEQKPYTVYSYFYKTAKTIPVRSKIKNNFRNYSLDKIKNDNSLEITIENKEKMEGGRRNALKILKNISEYKNYQKTRDYPGLDKTTKLSAHIRFGTISVREAYQAIKENLGIDHTLINQLYWREFFTYVLHHFPNSKSRTFKKKFRKIPWSTNKQEYHTWCKGETGFPIVDAGMRQLNKTGFMHNRVRMIVASFLTKDMHIDWKLGERYFAEKLVDYDPAVNAGNWQWAASTGCDAVPYFRIFNPWIQQEKFDSNCNYIKKWIPELETLQPKYIHNLWKKYPEGLTYPKPILNHKIESNKTKIIFKNQK